MHHLYFSGEPAEHMALGAFFSAAEVIPLVPDGRGVVVPPAGRRTGVEIRTPFPHRWAVMFLVAVGFWNFLGAGIFGFLINLPIVSYYEIGTALTANHGHAAMMGVYGMLAIGLALFCLRYLIPPSAGPRSGRASRSGRRTSASRGCASRPCSRSASRSSTSPSTTATGTRATSRLLTEDTNTLIEWLRLPGDIVFIAGGRCRSLHRLRRHPAHGEAGDARGAGGHPVHRDRTARGAGEAPRGDRREGHVSPEAVLGRLMRRGCWPALALEWLSAHTHRRSLRFRTTAGFEYRDEHDVWVCPEGEHLWPHEFDHQRRLVRYRARRTSATRAR